MNLIETIQALSLRDKEELYSHIGQLILEEKFYKETMNTWFNYPGLYKEEVTIWNKIKQEYETD